MTPLEHAQNTLHEEKKRIAREMPNASPEEVDRILAPLRLAATTEPYPAIEYIPPRLNTDDRARLHGLAVLLVDRTTEAARTMRTENLTAEGLTALAAATTAATTALLACSTDDDLPDGEEHRRESIRRARIEGAEKAMALEASGECADPIAAVREWAAKGGA